MTCSLKVTQVIGLVACLALTGCGGSGCDVSGKVLIDGQPFSNGRIALQPKLRGSHSRSVQAVITDGEFHFLPAQGIEPGQYGVVITARRKTGQQLPPEEGSGEVVERYEQYLPEKYNTATKLSAEITGDNEVLSFDLELPKQQARRR